MVCKLSGILRMRKQQKPLLLLGVELPSLGVRPIHWPIQQNDKPRVRLEPEVHQDKPGKSTQCNERSHEIQGYYKRNRYFQRYVVSKPLA